MTNTAHNHDFRRHKLEPLRLLAHFMNLGRIYQFESDRSWTIESDHWIRPWNRWIGRSSLESMLVLLKQWFSKTIVDPLNQNFKSSHLFCPQLLVSLKLWTNCFPFMKSHCRSDAIGIIEQVPVKDWNFEWISILKSSSSPFDQTLMW